MPAPQSDEDQTVSPISLVFSEPKQSSTLNWRIFSELDILRADSGLPPKGIMDHQRFVPQKVEIEIYSWSMPPVIAYRRVKNRQRWEDNSRRTGALEKTLTASRSWDFSTTF